MTTTLLTTRTSKRVRVTTAAAPTVMESAFRRVDGIVVGRVVGFDQAGRPLVRFNEAPESEPLAARATTVLGAEHVGRNVAILCECGDPTQPIIVGLMHPATIDVAEETDGVGSKREEIDLDLTAQRQITLRC